MNINDVLLGEILKNQKLELKIHLTSSFLRYFSVDGNSNFFKCRDLDEFESDTFENATESCRNNGGIGDLFDNFPDLNDEVRYSSTWSPINFQFNENYYKFFSAKKDKQIGFLYCVPYCTVRTFSWKFFSGIWTGYKRVNSSHFGHGDRFIRLDAFDPKFYVSKFGKVPP